MFAMCGLDKQQLHIWKIKKYSIWKWNRRDNFQLHFKVISSWIGKQMCMSVGEWSWPDYGEALKVIIARDEKGI